MKKIVFETMNMVAIAGLMFFVIQTSFSVAQDNEKDNESGRKIVVFQTALNDAAKDEIIAHINYYPAKLLNFTPCVKFLLRVKLFNHNHLKFV